jgi:hypothetical protein
MLLFISLEAFIYNSRNSLICCKKQKLFALRSYPFHGLFTLQVECVCWESGGLRAQKEQWGQNFQFRKEDLQVS